MRRIAFLAPLAAALAVSGAAAAQPSAVVVTVSPDFAQTARELGERVTPWMALAWNWSSQT